MIGVSHRFGSSLCYWIISEKEKVLSRTTIQHLTAGEPIDPGIQEKIRDFHGSLEDALGSKDFGTSLDGYDSFVNDDVEDIDKGYPYKDIYKGPIYYYETNKIIDNGDEEMAANYYDQ